LALVGLVCVGVRLTSSDASAVTVEVAKKCAALTANVIAPPPEKPGDDVRVIDLKIFDHTGTAVGMATRRAHEE
jgi:hypothetical protein